MPTSNILKAIEDLTNKAGGSTDYKDTVTIMNLTSMADSLEQIAEYAPHLVYSLERIAKHLGEQ